MANPIITDLETQRALQTINPKKAVGPDGLSPKVCKTLSLSQGPDDWRRPIVTQFA